MQAMLRRDGGRPRPGRRCAVYTVRCSVGVAMSTLEDQSVPAANHHASLRVADYVEPAEAAPWTRGVATVKEREVLEGHSLQPTAAATRKSRRSHATTTHDPNTKPGINTKKRARKNFIYGNYDTYYSYRPPSAPGDELTANESHIDPRLTVLLPSWLDQKRIIDIGCNSGDITFALATEFGATSVLGVDIDNSLIQRANNRLASERQKLNPDERLADLDFRCENVVARKYRRDFASQKRRGPTSTIKQPGSLVESGATRSERLPGANVKALAQTSDGAVYDVVVCFSVTKWVHLNWGDDGLRTLFQRVYDMLPSAGLFILEPQPWKSYKKKYNLTETTKTHFKSIEMRPSEFVAYLTEALGFHLLDTLRPAKAASPGFAARPIYVLQKLKKLKC